jgi:hypothetical protein
VYAKSWETWKVNIGTEDNPKFLNIGEEDSQLTARIKGPVSNYILIDERDFCGVRRNEDSVESISQTCEAETI